MTNFHAKIILFGEYTILHKGCGLFLPLPLYKGQLAKISSSSSSSLLSAFKWDEQTGKKSSNQAIFDFLGFLKNSHLLSQQLDLELLEKDLAQGLSFESSIPIGQGLGSSGAIVASLFYTYHKKKLHRSYWDASHLNYCKDLLALMESYYHGASSGLDPLVSFLDHGLLYQYPDYPESYRPLEIHDYHDFLSSFYLISTKVARKASLLVMQYLAKYEENLSFQRQVEEAKEIVLALIKSFLSKDRLLFNQHFYELSRWQYLHLSHTVTNDLKDWWFQGLESGDYYFKLCGAGGGGHYLCYVPNQKSLPPEFPFHFIEII